MAPSLAELNALLDNYIPLTKKVSDAKTEVMQKEAEALEKILARVWSVMRYMDTEGQAPYYRNKIDIIDHSERAITSDDSGFRFSNRLTLYEEGWLTRSHVVEHWGQGCPCFEFNDEQEIDCFGAVRCFGFEAICDGLADMLKCNVTLDCEFKELQTRIERADSLIGIMQEKFVIECRQSEIGQENLNPFSDSERPHKPLHCDRAFGLLSAIQQDDECIIATIGDQQVVLPEEMLARLEPLMNKRIGLARFYDEFYLRELEAS